MRSEFSYNAFVGNYSVFSDPIHPLPYLDADIAARVSDGEEGVFNDHLVGNVPKMDLHVMEVGHQVV